MSTFIRLAKLQAQTFLEYRVDLIVWRLRMTIGVLTVFLIWQAVYANADQLHGYRVEDMFSYVIFGNLFLSLISSNRIASLQGIISRGDLNDYLLKPVNIFAYLLTQDLAERVFNLLFTALELGVLYLIFRPQLVGVSSYQTLLVLLVLIPISSILYWLVSLTVSLTTFWYYQNGGWGQRFLADLLISFFAGSYFPLEFFPDVLAAILKTLPTSLFFYTPMQLFLGRMTHTQAVIQIGIGLGWIGVFYLIARLMWRTGIKNYGAFGR